MYVTDLQSGYGLRSAKMMTWAISVYFVVVGSEEWDGPVDPVCCPHNIERRDSEGTALDSKSPDGDETPPHRSKRQVPVPPVNPAAGSVLTVTSCKFYLFIY